MRMKKEKEKKWDRSGIEEKLDICLVFFHFFILKPYNNYILVIYYLHYKKYLCIINIYNTNIFKYINNHTIINLEQYMLLLLKIFEI